MIRAYLHFGIPGVGPFLTLGTKARRGRRGWLVRCEGPRGYRWRSIIRGAVLICGERVKVQLMT